LVSQGRLSDEVTPSLPKAGRDLYLITGEGLPANIHAQLYEGNKQRKELRTRAG
jgi:hypothetical protein